ncbi:Alpha/Beta hydrolase protein [Fennellomyces sp. T-0311]|nr:Alpha/Beta hydrolase protein [Fennellomyces sp. T-0311]
MTSVNEEWITTDDGYSLFTKTWKPAGQPIATAVMIHGFGEHIGRYDRMFTLFANEGIQTYGYDQRGWGQSGKKAHEFGNNHGYKTALSDINNAIKRTKQPDIPLFLIGHSMGGGLILNYLAQKLDGLGLVTGAIASAPLVTLSMPVSPFRYYPLMLASKVVPSFVIQVGMDPKTISHDEQEIAVYNDDPLVHDYATLATVRSFLDAGQALLKDAKKIRTPILYSHGVPDPVNDFKGTKSAYEITSSEDKTLKAWDGLFHELHNEKLPERDQVMRYYVEWITARSK